MSAEEYRPEFASDEKDWHILSGNRRFGPCRFSDLIGAVDRQVVKNSDFVWHPRWSDWRQVKSVPSLASAFPADFSDRDDSIAADAAAPMPALVNQFELRLRPASVRRPWFEQIILDERLVYLANIVLVGLTIFAAGGLSILIFGNDRHGAAYIAIEFTTLLLIGMAMTRRAGTQRFSTFRFCALSAFSALLLVVMNCDKVPDALDAWQGKRLLAPVRTSEQIQRVAHAAPANKFIRLVSTSYDATRQSYEATARLIKELEPQGLTFDVLRGATSRDQLLESARELRAAEARAALALPRYFSILESERAEIEQAGRKLYGDDPQQLLPGFLAALGRRQEQLRERMGRTFKAIGAYYSAMGDAAEFVAQHWEQYRVTRVSKVSFTVTDRGTNDQYNKLMTSARGAQAAVMALERDNRKFSSDLKILWTEAAKAR